MAFRSCGLIENRVYNLEKNSKGRMAEYNITKIIDGLFVGDQLVALDIPFLASNKVIRMFGWTAEPLQHHFQDEEVLEIVLSKNIEEVKFPDFNELEEAFSFLDVFQEQMLCGLIYSETQVQATLICVLYLMRRFRWNCNSTLDFLRTKIEMFQCSEQTIIQLEKYGDYLAQNSQTGTSQLSQVYWDYDFLESYTSKDQDEALIIATVKNKMRGNRAFYRYDGKNSSKKTKRIKWQDQLRPCSALSVNSVKRNSLLKGRLVSPTNFNTVFNPPLKQEASSKDLQLLYHSVGFKNSKLKEKVKENQNILEDSSGYQQLKEMSRTNFNDRHYLSSKVRRRGSLKPKHTMQTSKTSSSTISLQNLVGIYGPNSAKGLSKSSSAQSFLTGLRSFNKISGGHA